MPPHLVNYQSWLAAQGLQFQDGIVPEGNIVDSAAEAWNDSITVSEDNSSDSSSAQLTVQVPPASQIIPPNAEILTVNVEMHPHGLHFDLSGQGDAIMSLLLTDPVPRQHLNGLLFSALRPMLASVGLWNTGYGTRQEFMQVTVQVSSSAKGLHFTSTTQPSLGSDSVNASAVLIEEISDSAIGNLQGTPNTAKTQDDVQDGLAMITIPPPVLVNSTVFAPADTAYAAVILPHASDPVPEGNSVLLDTSETQSTLIFQTAPSTGGTGRRGKTAAPIDSANLRRNTRANKYDGFRVTHTSDSRPHKSKVKPRSTPAAPSSSSSASQNIMQREDGAPPPTPVPDIQAEGIHLCAIPEDELTTEALMAEDTPSSSSA